MSIVLVGSTSGSVTLQEPAIAGSTVLTLPAVSGTVLTTGSSGQSIPKAALPTGSVLQVVQGTTNTSTTISGGPTDTTLTATITPTSATSKILIIVNQFVYLYGGGGDSGFILNILRNGSNVFANSGQSLYVASSSGSPELITSYPITFLDSPATTSALTYKTQATANSGGTPVFQWSGNGSTIQLLEIAA